jgi:hypothetical protein
MSKGNGSRRHQVDGLPQVPGEGGGPLRRSSRRDGERAVDAPRARRFRQIAGLVRLDRSVSWTVS